VTGTVCGSMYVQVDGIQSNGVNFTAGPTVTSVSPTSGVGGTLVYISGNNFGNTQGGLNFNGVPAGSITSWTNSFIQATPPSNVTTGPVTVVANSITSNANVVFTVQTPAIGSLNPPAAATGATITLNGSGLWLRD
jgi:hypothetical protein